MFGTRHSETNCLQKTIGYKTTEEANEQSTEYLN